MQQDLDGNWRARLQDNWTRKDGQQWVSLQLEQDDDRSFGISIPMAELEGLGIRGDRLDRAATCASTSGAMPATSSSKDGSRWPGRRHVAFRAKCGVRGGDAQRIRIDLSTEQVFKLAIHDVSRSFIASMRQEGYSGLARRTDEDAHSRRGRHYVQGCARPATTT